MLTQCGHALPLFYPSDQCYSHLMSPARYHGALGDCQLRYIFKPSLPIPYATCLKDCSHREMTLAVAPPPVAFCDQVLLLSSVYLDM